MKLLTQAHQNAKTAKNLQFAEYLTAILHLAPFNLSGFNVCPSASNGCAMACLNTAGRGRFDNVQAARIRKTKLFFSDKNTFMAMLIKDIKALVKKADKNKQKAIVRLNGTSDIAWENYEAFQGLNIFELFPNVQFYDYTKRAARLDMSELPDNYHLTFSLSEVNLPLAKRLLKLGFNVAVVFKDIIPTNWNKVDVTNGDNHDLRFMEGYQGKWIGLKAKGKAKKDTTGFVKIAS